MLASRSSLILRGILLALACGEVTASTPAGQASAEPWRPGPLVVLGFAGGPARDVAPRADERWLGPTTVETLRDTPALAQQLLWFGAAPVGSLSVRVPLRGARVRQLDAHGVTLSTPGGGAVHYGPLAWVDVAGRRWPLAVRDEGDALRLEVPAQVLAETTWPAVLDPFITPAVDVDPPVQIPGSGSGQLVPHAEGWWLLAEDGVAEPRLYDVAADGSKHLAWRGVFPSPSEFRSFQLGAAGDRAVIVAQRSAGALLSPERALLVSRDGGVSLGPPPWEPQVRAAAMVTQPDHVTLFWLSPVDAGPAPLLAGRFDLDGARIDAQPRLVALVDSSDTLAAATDGREDVIGTFGTDGGLWLHRFSADAAVTSFEAGLPQALRQPRLVSGPGAILLAGTEVDGGSSVFVGRLLRDGVLSSPVELFQSLNGTLNVVLSATDEGFLFAFLGATVAPVEAVAVSLDGGVTPWPTPLAPADGGFWRLSSLAVGPSGGALLGSDWYLQSRLLELRFPLDGGPPGAPGVVHLVANREFLPYAGVSAGRTLVRWADTRGGPSGYDGLVVAAVAPEGTLAWGPVVMPERVRSYSGGRRVVPARGGWDVLSSDVFSVTHLLFDFDGGLRQRSELKGPGGLALFEGLTSLGDVTLAAHVEFTSPSLLIVNRFGPDGTRLDADGLTLQNLSSGLPVPIGLATDGQALLVVAAQYQNSRADLVTLFRVPTSGSDFTQAPLATPDGGVQDLNVGFGCVRGDCLVVYGWQDGHAEAWALDGGVLLRHGPTGGDGPRAPTLYDDGERFYLGWASTDGGVETRLLPFGPDGVPGEAFSVPARVDDLTSDGDGGALIAFSTPERHSQVQLLRVRYLGPGEACTTAVDCQSAHCVDGVCCASACGGGDLFDCQACSVAAGGAQDGVCGPAQSGALCRPPETACAEPSRCDGVATTCPAVAPGADRCLADGGALPTGPVYSVGCGCAVAGPWPWLAVLTLLLLRRPRARAGRAGRRPAAMARNS